MKEVLFKIFFSFLILHNLENYDHKYEWIDLKIVLYNIQYSIYENLKSSNCKKINFFIYFFVFIE